MRTAASDIDPHFFVEAASLAAPPPHSSPCFYPQTGRDFGERLRHAARTVAALGYTHIVIIGGDCPDLASADIAHAAARLRESDAVLGPDHRGGLYLIGLHAADLHLLDAVVWRHNTDCAQLQSLYAGRRVSLLSVKLDLDGWADLRLFARLGSALHRWLARELAALAGAGARPVFRWIDLAQQSAQARRMTSPPLAVA